MEASHKTHRPHIKVGKDAEEEVELYKDPKQITNVTKCSPGISYIYKRAACIIRIIHPPTGNAIFNFQTYEIFPHRTLHYPLKVTVS